MQASRIVYKCEAFAEAWRRHHGRSPSLNETVLGVAVALGETAAGDAWPGVDGVLGTVDDERNWGACNLRKLDDIRMNERIVIAAKARELIATDTTIPHREFNHPFDRLEFTDVPQRYVWTFHDAKDRPRQSTLSGLELQAAAALIPTVSKGHEKRARAVHQLLAEQLEECPAGAKPLDGKRGAIHCDSHPGLGPFFVWFAAFNDPAKTSLENEIDGAAYFVRIVSRTASEKQALASGDPGAMAAAMYGAGYYGGFHRKGVLYEQPDGSKVDGAILNVRDYTRVISRHAPAVRAALSANAKIDAAAAKAPRA
jgi:hypothetical protein